MTVKQLIKTLELIPFKNLPIQLSSDAEGNSIADIHEVSDETDNDRQNPEGCYVIWPK